MNSRGRPEALRIALPLESDGPGGAEWMLIHLAEGLRARGHEVLPIGPANGIGWLRECFEARGFRPRTFRLDHPYDLGCVFRLARLFRKNRISLVHSHEFTMSVFGTAAASLARIPAVITLHSAQRFPDKRRRRMAVRWAAGRASAATTVSEATRREIQALLDVPPEAWGVVPNGVPSPCGDERAVRLELGLLPGEPLILAVGSLYKVKGHDVLVRASAILRERLPHLRWKVAVAGGGREEGRLTDLAEGLGVRDRVVLLGHRSDVGALLRAAEIFVHPSRSEGLPLAIIEAMHAGLPVVASDVGGIGEVVTDGLTGHLLPPDQPTHLAGTLEALLLERERGAAMGGEGRRIAEARFGLDVMVDRYVEIYAESLGRK